MLKSFFFIPGSHPKLLEKIQTIKADHIIIDLEDAFEEQKIDETFLRLRHVKNIGNVFVRINFFDKHKNLDKKLFYKLISLNISKFIIPKFESFNQLQKIEKFVEDKTNLKFVLLVENPSALFSLIEILSKTKLNIIALGFGSHDYSNEVGMKHDIDLFYYPRFLIVGLSKMFNLISIDIACMDVDNEAIFQKEVEYAYDFGFDAKFIIHPKQLDRLKRNELEIERAKEILNYYYKNGKPKVFKYKGKAIEPPHIKYFEKLLKNESK